jgi:transposase
MRKGYDGLYGLVAGRLAQDPLSGHLFVFCNGSRNRIKVLFWDSTGLWVGAKRLEKGRFWWPEAGSDAVVTLGHERLGMLLAGIDLAAARNRRGWFRKAGGAAKKI